MPPKSRDGRTRPGAREERDTPSLSSPSLHFNQGLRYKILLSRAFQLWTLKHPHALSQLLLHKKKVKKKEEKSTTTKHQNPHREKEVFFFFITIQKNNTTKKWGGGENF